MPLVAKPRDHGRRDSALSVASYMSEDDADDRSESPTPPRSSTPSGQRRSLLRSTTSGSMTDLHEEAAKALDDVSLEELERARDDGAMGTGAGAGAAAEPEQKKPNVVILAGLLGMTASCRVDEAAKLVQVLPTCYAPLVIERLSRAKAPRALPRAVLVERSGFPVMWRTHEETNNWLWGDLVWKTFEAYVIVMQTTGRFKGMNLYEILRSDARARRVYAGLIDEARSALRWQRVDLMDAVTSPFALDFAASRALLLLPDPLFRLALWALLFFREPVPRGAEYCENSAYVRAMAPFLNGEVVRIGFESEVATPLNQEILEMLSRTAGVKPLAAPPFADVVLPPPVPPSRALLFLSALAAAVAVLVKLAQFSWFLLTT